MKRNFLLATCIFFTNIIMAQYSNSQIEINPFIRFDKYPKFSYVLGGRPSTDYVTIKGNSFGIDIAYKIPIGEMLFLKTGIGYYKYSFNNIKRVNTNFGDSKSRNINFISPLLIPFFTDKYHYSSWSANIGLEKVVLTKNNYLSIIGMQINNYFTFLQNYHLTNNPNGSKIYKKNNKNYFGSSGFIYISVLKKIERINIGPSLIIPVFDIWKTDPTFQQETTSGTRNKWFKAIGIGISFNYSLTKNKKL